ncbi:hypothetical protein BGX21_007202, partial [Mortierella sp. AD011]
AQTSNKLQAMIGLFLFSTGSQRKVVDFFSAAGLSVSYNSIMSSLEGLTNDAMARVKLAIVDGRWFLLYDNLNIALGIADQRFSKIHIRRDWTTASLVRCLETGAILIPPNMYQMISLQNLIPNKGNYDRLRLAYQYHITEALKRYYKCFDDCPNPAPCIKRIPVQKTEAYPLRLMKINESTIAGNQEILDHVMLKEFGLSKAWFDDGRLQIVAGDQLTVARLRSLKKLSRGDQRS